MPGLSLIDAGRVTLTAAILQRNVCLALGSGSASWSTPPPDPAVGDTGLVAPIAMIRPSTKSFVSLSPTGTIEMSDGTKWNLSNAKTRFLFVQYVLQYSDGPTDQYRELAIYLDPTFAAGVPVGQNYIPWAQVTSPGDLLALERFNMIDGSGSKEFFGRIMTF